MRVLLIEDDSELGEAVRDQIIADGKAVDLVQSLSEAEHAFNTVPYEIVLLDLNLPDGHGLDFLRRLRQRGDATPIIILTAKDQISDRIAGLNSGADDYLVKPFDLDELSARVSAVARRYTGNPNPLISFGSLEFDQANRMVFDNGQIIDLTGREWAVLDLLLRRPNSVVSKSQIEQSLYEFGSEIESNTVEVYVSRIRKKLGRSFIKTVRGIGYRLDNE